VSLTDKAYGRAMLVVLAAALALVLWSILGCTLHLHYHAADGQSTEIMLPNDPDVTPPEPKTTVELERPDEVD